MAGPPWSARQKAELRSSVLQKRDALTAETARACSHAVCELLSRVEPLTRYTAIAGYASIRNEIDVRAYLAQRQREGARLFFPRVYGPAELEFVPVDDLATLSPGAFGVPEPIGKPVSTADIELFLVPGVAFDRHGARLGFGRGFYDRALADTFQEHQHTPVRSATSRLRVGICYQWQLVEGQLPVEPHDIPMDVIATDQETIFCSRGRLA